MHKSILFAAVGVTVFLAGCPDDVMNDVYYRPAPGGADIQQPAPVPAADPAPVVDPAQAAPAAVVTTPKYLPMTDVVSSGGVDSATGKKSAAKAGKDGQYIVKRGDTPEKIARRHGVKLSALMSVNNLTQESARRLRIGQKLIIPGKSAKAAPAKSIKSAKKSSAPAPALEGGKYTVKSGDTPERIARRYKVKLSELLSANNLDEAAARRLQIGQKLIIPGQTAATEKTATPATTIIDRVDNTVTTDTQPKAVVTDNTQTTDPAAAIPSTETGTTTNTDEISDIDSVEVDSDTTFAECAAKLGITEEELRKANGNTTEIQIKKGDLIFVPKKKN